MAHSNQKRRNKADSGIVSLMEDLGEALNVNPELLFLGGGNPARVPEFESRVAEHLKKIVEDPMAVHRLAGVYQSPRGSEELIGELVRFFRTVGYTQVSKENIAITCGSQSAFFILFNMLVTHGAESEASKICFPIMPEYLGYRDQVVFQGDSQASFIGCQPNINLLDEHFFKYTIDFTQLEGFTTPAAYCISRPTNPSGNVITHAEFMRLKELADVSGVPLIVDCAYGDPFPGVIYESTPAPWGENIIYVMSLSKLGLPGARTGIIVGNEAIIHEFIKINTIMSLANSNFGPTLMTSLLKNNEITPLCKQTILPFYERKREFAIACIKSAMEGFPYRLHVPEGAFFLWLWLENLPVPTSELYERVKRRGVIVMDGEHFFFGLHDAWQHSKECVRLTYCQDNHVIQKGIEIMADEIKAIYSG